MNDKVVLGWTRDKRGAVVDRHPVQVANAVTAAKRDNTQNYVVENVGRINKGLSGRMYGVNGISPTICAEEGVKYNTKIAINTDTSGCEHMIGIMENVGRIDNGVVAINTDASGCARTIGCHYKDMDASSVLKKSGTGFGYVRTGIIEYNGALFRIRKLTERECFRLMGVSESDIDKIQASGVSRSRQYCLAGNSIVVDVLEKIFDKLFIHTEKTSKQLTLF